MERLGRWKRDSHEEAARKHRALPLEERLAAAERLYRAHRASVAPEEPDDSGVLAFYARARALGLVDP